MLSAPRGVVGICPPMGPTGVVRLHPGCHLTLLIMLGFRARLMRGTVRNQARRA
jgi:hypothetical protein